MRPKKPVLPTKTPTSAVKMPSTTNMSTKPAGAPMGGVRPQPSPDAMKKAFASQGERPYNTKPTGPVASPAQMISTLANKANAPRMPMKKGGLVSTASKRADGCATKGKTKGRMI